MLAKDAVGIPERRVAICRASLGPGADAAWAQVDDRDVMRWSWAVSPAAGRWPR